MEMAYKHFALLLGFREFLVTRQNSMLVVVTDQGLEVLALRGLQRRKEGAGKEIRKKNRSGSGKLLAFCGLVQTCYPHRFFLSDNPADG